MESLELTAPEVPLTHGTLPLKQTLMEKHRMNNLPLDLMNDQLVDMVFITTLTGLTDKWFYKLIQLGQFPKQIKLGRSSRWLKSEVEAWLRQRINASRGDTAIALTLEDEV